MKPKIFLIPILLITVVAAAIYIYVRQGKKSPEPAEKPIAGQNGGNIDQAAENGNFNACGLISNSEIEDVQGGKVKATKNSSRISGSMLVSQCFYELDDYSKSVSFEITQAAPNLPEKPDLEKIWEEKFNVPAEVDNDREEEEEAEKKGDADEPGNGAKPIPQIGEAAFRVGNSITDALYVLKNNSIIRVSVGGADAENAKLEKLKKISLYALKRV